MIKHRDSHVDHGLDDAQICYLLDRFALRDTFFLETIELPEELGTVPCGLWGPAMGDPPITEAEVIHAPRGTRPWTSRLIERPLRPSHLVTVIAGPHEERCPLCQGNGCAPGSPKSCEAGKLRYTCVLYTAFGGPPTPQEPGDPGCTDLAASIAFWRSHALTK